MELSSTPFLEFITLMCHLYIKATVMDTFISFVKWRESQLRVYDNM